MADPSPAAVIEMDTCCGGRSHVEGFLEVMEVQVTCDDSEAVLSLGPSLEARCSSCPIE
jgi:hypothetical protein